MEELVRYVTQVDVLLESDMLNVVLLGYFFTWLFLVASFINIYSMDRYEYLNNRQRCIRFKHRMFFIIMYSKEKNIVSKKTFILESIGYAIFLLSIIAIIISLKLNVKIALLLLGIVAFAVLVYAWIVADMDYKVENGKRK